MSRKSRRLILSPRSSGQASYQPTAAVHVRFGSLADISQRKTACPLYPRKRTFAVQLPCPLHSGTPDIAHEIFLNMAQTTKATAIIAAAKTIRKVLVSSAMGPPFLAPVRCAYSGYPPGQLILACGARTVHRRSGPLVARKLVPDVRFGSLADICSAKRHVRFTPESGHSVARSECLLSANSGHRVVVSLELSCLCAALASSAAAPPQLLDTIRP